MIDPREIERLVELSGLATEGPWAYNRWSDQAEAVTVVISGDFRVEHPTPGIRGGNYRDTKWGSCEHDAAFIAALVNFFRAHHAELEHARQLERDRAELIGTLKRLREWDMVHEPAAGVAEPCADAPWARNLIDTLLARLREKGK